MKFFARITLLGSLVATTLLSTATVGAQAASTPITTTPTGYTSAEQVVYKTEGKYVKNWGARGENCAFLSVYAQEFYTGENVYSKLSQKAGGTSYTNAPQSALYKSLHGLMEASHSYIIGYQATRDLYKYTDCVSSNSEKISSYYSGIVLNGKWDAAATWNREHCWPKSKCINTSKAEDSADIMMLRPTSVNENSSRGNDAYGESNGYYEPHDSVKGDCARLVLYGYTRWENTSKMWGADGVMESKDVLLRWMEEDPVDTWEMGRNDAVQAITGTRNVFVDYPEYAWLLLGEAVPKTVLTPSGEAKNDKPSVEDKEEGEEGIGSDENVGEDSESTDVDDSSVADKNGESSDSADERGSAAKGGCASSVSLALGGVVFAVLGAYVLKERRKR